MDLNPKWNQKENTNAIYKRKLYTTKYYWHSFLQVWFRCYWKSHIVQSTYTSSFIRLWIVHATTKSRVRLLIQCPQLSHTINYLHHSNCIILKDADLLYFGFDRWLNFRNSISKINKCMTVRETTIITEEMQSCN